MKIYTVTDGSEQVWDEVFTEYGRALFRVQEDNIASSLDAGLVNPKFEVSEDGTKGIVNCIGGVQDYVIKEHEVALSEPEHKMKWIVVHINREARGPEEMTNIQGPFDTKEEARKAAVDEAMESYDGIEGFTWLNNIFADPTYFMDLWEVYFIYC